MWKRSVRLAPLVASLLLSGEMVTAQSEAAKPPGVIAPLNIQRFHILLFTSQNMIKLPRATHTWAVMVRSVDGRILDAQTISWLPVDLKVKPFYLFVEPGGNYPLDFTLGRMRQEHERISLWGPYEAVPQLYERFIARKAYLESGALGYQCCDFLARLHYGGTESTVSMRSHRFMALRQAMCCNFMVTTPARLSRARYCADGSRLPMPELMNGCRLSSESTGRKSFGDRTMQKCEDRTHRSRNPFLRPPAILFAVASVLVCSLGHF